ncbi:MAG: exodeoxyribonuclease VII small subunit [Chloroflexi bacterium]|nr:exodeoxyribonuclease VII small subunit [Chloroflexota bacterium]
MASKPARPGKQPAEPFEELYRRLEEAVAKLEAGGLSLDEAIGLYEEGMKLAQRCQEMLDSAELRITRLQEAFAAYTEGAVREEVGAYDLPEEEEPPAE